MDIQQLFLEEPLIIVLTIAGLFAASIVASALTVLAIGSAVNHKWWMATGLSFMALVMVMKLVGIIIFDSIISVTPYWIVTRTVDIGFAIFIMTFAIAMHRGHIKKGEQ